MKLLSVLLLLSTQVFADTFVAEKTIQASTSTYSNPTKVELSVLSLNSHLDQAVVSVNGVEKTVNVKLESYQENTYTYAAVVANEVLANGAACDEMEEFIYLARITVNEQAKVSVTTDSLELTRVYTYDVCHSPMKKETVKYTKI